jgi:hypothetical protein
MVDLLDWSARQQFELQLTAQVERSDRAGAVARVEQEILDSGDAALQDAADASTTITIEPWDEIVADWLDAQRGLARRSARPEVVALDLVNRDSFPDLRVRRRFYANPKEVAIHGAARYDLDEWRPPAEEEAVVLVRGLQALVAVQRTHNPSARRPELDQQERAQTLAGLLIVIRYMDAVERSLHERGLPAAVPVLVSVDSVQGPREPGSYDYGPRMTEVMRSTAAPAIGERTQAISAARATARAQRWEDDTSRLIADLRRIHQAVTSIRRLFMPRELRGYYRVRARGFDKSLANGMGIHGLPPLRRMSARELDELEHRVREVRKTWYPY